ncbi:uncharacterized protein LOC132718403 [Ruditapes philippinarum]|uniref:uncharacterized protein LOC132718403 n=1 Tax=Ruditapes philippinarum TaxID=129788 RepID=UPI00295AE1A9|nr:uncharacterized protein LOC132718403 [Ruditapes philippinarum]XP_060558082.1 uncharacterized protein LOC132718403 [Ruditapes philippinarum]
MLDSNVYGMKYVILILCTGLFIYPSAANGPRCFDCLRMPYLHECDHIKQCGPHQVCYSKQIVSDSGFVYYDTGCIDQLICNARDSLTDHADDGQADDVQADEKGDIITCLECCDGEFCNDRGCGTKGLSTNQTGPSCFACPKGSVSPWHCDKVTTCGRDEKCFIQQVSGIGGNVLYKSGCTSSCAFDLIGVGTIVGKRSLATGCSGCCGTDFCNSNCSLLENNVLSPTKHAVTVESTQTITITSGQHSTSTMPTTTATPVCRHSHYIYAAMQGTCYHVYDNKQLSMSAARQECQKEGADLLQLKDSNAEHFFQHLTFNDKENNNRRYWLGAHKHTDGNFYWLDGRQ